MGELQYGDIPNITGTFANGESEYHRLPIYNATGCFTNGGSSTISTHDIDGGWNGGRLNGIKLDASRSSTVYKSVTGVKPKRLYVGGYIIRY